VNKMKYEKILIVLLCVLILCALALAAQIPLLKGMASAEGLPAGRVYEMVTPATNYDADVYVPLGLPEEFVPNAGEFETRLPFQIASNGEAVTYLAAPTIGGTGNSGLGKGDEYLSRRSSEGSWERPTDIQPLGEKGAVVNSAFYQAFSPDLTIGILESGSVEEPIAPLLSPLAPSEGYAVLYSHAVQGGSYQPLFTMKPSNRSPAEFETSGIASESKIAPHQLAYAGASANYERLLFEANGTFNATGAANGNITENNLYESVGGQLSLVNVLPDGDTEANATFGANPINKAHEPPPDFSNVISEDGSRVFWADLNEGKEALYVSEGIGTPSEHTIQIDASQISGGKGGEGRFWTASKSGSEVFFTDDNQLTNGSTTASGSPDLYVYDVESGQLTDLTVDEHLNESADVQGVLGEGETQAGEYVVYFAAEGVLAKNENNNGIKAEQGADNLYMLRRGTQPVFVAIATPEDGNEAIEHLAHRVGEVGDWTPGIGRRTAEVTPDGGSLVFMSNDQKFNGHYEEVDGERLEEVYVYDAEDGKFGGLFCASCARDGLKAEYTREVEEGDLGAFVPVSNALTYQPSVISSDGSRVFFDSAEPLVSGDTNGELDVYEWDRDGTNGCAVTGGCVYLLSGGDASTSSWLVGGDESGSNVFFVTRAQLVPEDENENYDLYDARVDGLQRVSPPACSGTGCQGVPASAPTFATPSSVTFEGVGDFAPPAETTAPATPKVKTRPPTNAQKLVKALKACRKDAKGGKRASCEKRARSTYGGAKRK
jgi:hypothetical protein